MSMSETLCWCPMGAKPHLRNSGGRRCWKEEKRPAVAAYEIVMTDAELAEREEWIDHLTQIDPAEDTEFEYDLERWEANRS